MLVLGWIAAMPVGFAAKADFRQIAPNVYVAQAPNEAPSPENRGFVSNLGFIVGRTGVVAIGTGASERAGREMLDAIRSVTRKPVVLAINLQATPDHVLGNRSFVRRGIPVLAHRETDRFMAYNCPNCIRNARQAVGARRLGAAAIARPGRILDGSITETAGGSELEVRYAGHTFQAGSLMVFDRRSGTLFAGEVLSSGRIPDVRNADIEKWLAVLQELSVSTASRVVPAHGAVGEPGVAVPMIGYLSGLTAKVRELYDSGVAMQDAAREAAMNGYAGWRLYVPMHSSNIHFTFLKVEAEDLARQ